VADPLFGITLSIVAFGSGTWVQKKTRSALANPLIIAMVLVMLVLVIFDIPLEAYEAGGSFITFFLPPVATVLALSIYRQRKILRAYLIPSARGTLAGSIVAVASTVITGMAGNILAPYLGKIFGVTDKVAHGVGIGTSSHALGTNRARSRVG